jgi:ABC-type glycerol-3-phosphate transport system substrate-binding protein
MGELFAYDLMTDITPLVKQTATDLNQVASDDGWLVGIPFTQQFSALYYNKDIFDKFGVSYPKDGMTWSCRRLGGDFHQNKRAQAAGYAGDQCADVEKEFPKVVTGAMDSNTFIRQAQEQINKMLAEQ